MNRVVKVHSLHGNQMKAVEPAETVWLSASAGTGKTQVLTSRVLRLLLEPNVEPSAILCLTFTKAGATEMSARIKDRLATWVRAKPAELAAELNAIGADLGPGAQARARTLFASVLDCPGGGLRIDTIHAFSQWLLAAFPHEAGLVPGTRPMEDRERTILARQVLADLLVKAQNDPLGDPQLADAVADLSLRMGPDVVEAYLLRCAEAREAWFGPGGWQEPMRPNVLRLFGLPSDTDDDSVARLCSDDAFDGQSLQRCMEINAEWGTKTGLDAAARIGAWLAGDGAHRAATIGDLADVFLKKDGDPRSYASQEKKDPAYGDYAARVAERIAPVRELKILLELAERFVPALRLGRAFALVWDEAKQREGLIDFDDQIRQAAALLNRSDLAEWIRYKLDRRFDHILVDEAQDTNKQQWDIINALTGDFFAGLGQHGDIMRTLFVVGDYKQAIFRFQGTSPENFRKARDGVRDAMAGAVENAATLRSNHRPRPLKEYGLDRSFRSAQKVLDFVDRAIGEIGHESFGLGDAPDRHEGHASPGYVALWRPVGLVAEDDRADEPEEGEANWLSKPDRQMAENIALQIKAWTDEKGEGFYLTGKGRRAGPGDIMVLVRKRRELAGLIVARLHAHGVPVAGVDRLRLGAPLAVRDLVAALRFAAQPLDDLNLACLLVSPLIGWSQDELLRFGYRKKGVRLWEHLRRSSNADAAAGVAQLLALLGKADFDPPQQLLTWLLTGPWQGRRKLIARLGREANDPIDELLNAAHAYASVATPSLAGFLHWFDAGEGELKREADNASGLVRVMTAHGSKGLEAPLVILADATGNPESGRSGGLTMPDPASPHDRAIPLPVVRKDERVGRLAEHFEAERSAEMEEHWRLLYVAMTRAEEALFIGGALGVRDGGEAHENSWYARLRQIFPTGEEVADPIWSGRLDWGQPPEGTEPSSVTAEELPLAEVLQPWLMRTPLADPRPPKPLAPSNLGEEEAPDPPFPPGSGGQAARRGTLIHKLLERLPDVAVSEREMAGRRWLDRNATDFSADERAAMLVSAGKVLAEPGWADLFSPSSLAEVPVAATIGGRALAGTIDRLLVDEERVLIVDFKTSRRPPEDLSGVPSPILRQMAAYSAALEKVYPGRRIEAALLYTAAPRLIVVPQDVLEENKQALMAL
ncbi:MAG: double-strand break repair helicase AddA [Sphingomonadaceae bacterium]|nr:double-strand break repair helicase AddA [Sphingomonadaceae bacterium]